MILVYMKTGECIELEAARSATREGSTLICLDAHGDEIARFPALEVEAFTANPWTAEIMREEVCEELTVIPPEAEEGSKGPVL